MNVPSDARGRAELFLTIHLWAIDRVVEAINDFWKSAAGIPWTSGPPLEPTVLQRSEFIRTLLEPSYSWPSTGEEADIPEVHEADAWKMRIKRLDEERIRPGQHDALMADVLTTIRNAHTPK